MPPAPSRRAPGLGEAQGQTGLVVHARPDGSAVWLWHACVACARSTGRLRTHARFGAGGGARCPIAEAPTAALGSAGRHLHGHVPGPGRPPGRDPGGGGGARPLGPSNGADHRAIAHLKHQESCIADYERQRNELMTALSTALVRLHNLGASYPHWVWEVYEQGRTQRYTYFKATV